MQFTGLIRYIIENNDYIPVAMTLTFQDSGQHVCVNVTINDDQILENTENFTVRPSTSDPDVIITNSTATLVEIDNNDSMKPAQWRHFIIGLLIYYFLYFTCIRCDSWN